MGSVSLSEQRNVPPPDITAYPIRWRVIPWIVVGGVCSLLIILGSPTALALGFVTSIAQGDTGLNLGLGLLVGVLGLAAIEALGWLGLWTTRLMIHLLTSKAPMLTVSPQGIRVGKIYGTSEIMLPWEDIASIFLRSEGGYRQLCVRPTNGALFARRLGMLTRAILRVNRLFSTAPIAVNQSFLDKPIQTILQEIHDTYAQELAMHQVDLQLPEDSTLGTLIRRIFRRSAE